MRTLIATLLLASAAFGQNVSRVYHFMTIQGGPAYQEAANTLRSLGDIRDVTVDATAATLTASGTPDQMALVDWLLPQLDQDAGKAASSPAYQMSGNMGAVQVFRLSYTTSPREIQELVNVVRTTADMQRIYGANSSGSIVGRGSVDQLKLTGWLVAELDHAGPNPAAGVHATQFPGVRDPEVRIFHLAHTTTPVALLELVNSIRTIADVNRVFPCSTQAALVIRAPSESLALAEWLVGQLDLPRNQQGPAPHQQDAQGPSGNIARVFYLQQARSPQEVQTVANTLRSTAKLQRIFQCLQVNALSVRGSADQIAQAEKLIAELDR